jgi:hypothetical protein
MIIFNNKKTFLTLNCCTYKLKGCALAAIKKRKTLEMYMGPKTKIKKKGGGNQKRSPISSSTLFFYDAHDRRDRSLGPHLVSQKKRKILKEKEVVRRTETQKIRNKIRTITKKTVIGLTGRLQARSPADPNKKTFCLKRRGPFLKRSLEI